MAFTQYKASFEEILLDVISIALFLSVPLILKECWNGVVPDVWSDLPSLTYRLVILLLMICWTIMGTWFGITMYKLEKCMEYFSE